MIVCFCLCLLLGIESPEEMQYVSPRPENPPVETVENTLEQEKTSLEAHRGYLRYLADHPGIARAEEAWLELNMQTGFAAADRVFDETLNDHPEAQRLFDQFYDQLARDQDLRRAVESIQRVELTEKAAGPSRAANDAAPAPFSAALQYLRAHPDTGLRFLENPQRVKPTPDALLPLLDHFKQHPEILQELSSAFQQISDNPLAQLRLFPWWKQISGLDEQSQAAYETLLAEFLQHPNHFWIWHQRYLALAADVQARAWIRYWHRQVRRTPGLGDNHAYLAYLQKMRRQPESAARAEKRWAGAFGPPPAWPPKESPPLLSYLPRNKSMEPVEKKKVRMPAFERPEKPSIPRPQKPVMPNMPAMPQRPAKPEKPPKPPKPEGH